MKDDKKNKADAIATIDFMITSAMVKTTFQTGIQAGRSADILRKAIMEKLLDPSIRWAFKVLSENHP